MLIHYLEIIYKSLRYVILYHTVMEVEFLSIIEKSERAITTVIL